MKNGEVRGGTEASVRKRLFASALHLFTRKGYASTTVQEIVLAASVTKPVLYYYFNNKEAIYLELFGEPYAQFDALLERAAEGEGSARERLFRLIDEMFLLTEENIEVVRLMYALYYGPPQGAPFFDFDAYHRKLHSVVRTLVVEATESGELDPDLTDDLVWAVLGAINVAIETRLSHPDLQVGREGVARIMNLAFAGASRMKRERGV